ncbi:MAG: nucleotidyltransferase family protein [Oscillospiraceae bacterium]|nr:nucleotidyltransferase family protein [Oscillospiraceae bacterium]
MAIVGIICEYNPLHTGHAFQMSEVRRRFGADTGIVCVMSGDFVQRGQPAVFDKLARARAAIACGADLVLELPLSRALSSAEGFAAGGIEILDRLGMVDAVCFGSETADGSVERAAAAMEDPAFDALLREELQEGISYGAAKQRALEKLTGEVGILRTPNDILGAEYCRALLRRKSAIRPLTVKRAGDYRSAALDEAAPSATALRELLKTGGWEPYVPEAAREVFASAVQHRWEYGARAVAARLRTIPEAEWKTIAHGGEGLWRKLRRACMTQTEPEALCAAILSKRYPATRAARLVLCAYLGVTQDELTAPIGYVRVLAANERGKRILRESKKTGDLPLLNLGQRPEDRNAWDLERLRGDLYALFADPSARPDFGREKRLRTVLEEPQMR